MSKVWPLLCVLLFGGVFYLAYQNVTGRRRARQDIRELLGRIKSMSDDLSSCRPQTAPPRRTELRSKPLARPLVQKDFPTGPVGIRWSPKTIPLQAVPVSRKPGEAPDDEKRLRYIKYTFRKYMRNRRRRIEKGIKASVCRRQKRYLRRHRRDPHAQMTMILCESQHHFRAQTYIQLDYGGMLILHQKEWGEHAIRSFLARYQVLVQMARVLGFSRLLFVSTEDLKTRHKLFDFENKWYGQMVTFSPL